MKRIQINAAKILLPAVLAITLFSCVRKDNFFSLNAPSTRQTLVKILNGGTPAAIIKNPVDFVAVPQQLLVADVRRDPNDEGGLNTAMTVIVKDDTAAVKAANSSYLHLPAAWYTIQSESPKVGGMGGTFTFLYKPGEFAKQIYITIPDATKLDPSALYAVGFTITSVDDGGRIATAKSVIIEIGAKNPWDGIYAVTGSLADAGNANLAQWNNPAPSWGDPFPIAHGGAWECRLITTGATRCIVLDNTIWGIPAHPLLDMSLSPPGNSGYSSFAVVMNFNAATNAVSSIYNYYGDPASGPANGLGNPAGGSGPPNYAASNSRRADLDPTGVNAAQGNKDILLKYFMYQPTVIPVGPRVAFNEKYQYIGPR